LALVDKTAAERSDQEKQPHTTTAQ